MILLKHIGIYVSDLKMMTAFYVNVFGLSMICEGEKDRGDFLDCLVGRVDSEIKVTKLITEAGKQKGFGDMIELIQSVFDPSNCINTKGHTECGVMHVAFGVENIHELCDRIVRFGGKVIVSPFVRPNGNWLCFAQDPEGNWIEIIQNG